MNQIERLIKTLDSEILYTIPELIIKCNTCGVSFTREKLWKDVNKGKLPASRFGTRSAWQIQGKDFIAFIMTNVANATKMTNETNVIK